MVMTMVMTMVTMDHGKQSSHCDRARILSMVTIDLRTVTGRALYSPSGSSACGEIEHQGGQLPVEFIKRGGKGEWPRSAITRSVLIAFSCLISWSECVRKAIQSGFGFIATASCAIPPSRTLPNGS